MALKIITGLPGHNKTSNTLAEFLALKGVRPLYATFINGFDYDKHGVGRLDHLNEIFSLPPGSLVLCDEAQKFLRPRGKAEALPTWVAEFETHRHLGIDLWYTTQHPMLIDVHVRRLTEEHWHYFRPKGIQRLTTRRQWDGVRDDPNDYHAKQEAEIKSAAPPKAIFDEYISTKEDTNKSRFPRKLIYSGLAILMAISFIGYKVYGFVGRGYPEPVKQAEASTQPATALALPQPGVAPTTAQVGPRPLSLEDFQPVSELAPWSAPVYAGAAKIVAAPRFAGCMATSKGCSCVTQQGSYLEVDRTVCISVVYGKAMPFNPFKPDSPDYRPEDRGSQGTVLAAADESKVLIVGQDEPPKERQPYKSIYAR